MNIKTEKRDVAVGNVTMPLTAVDMAGRLLSIVHERWIIHKRISF